MVVFQHKNDLINIINDYFSHLVNIYWIDLILFYTLTFYEIMYFIKFMEPLRLINNHSKRDININIRPPQPE